MRAISQASEELHPIQMIEASKDNKHKAIELVNHKCYQTILKSFLSLVKVRLLTP